MIIIIDSQIKIKKPSKEIIDFCKKELVIPNPEIQKKKAMRILDRQYSKEYKDYKSRTNEEIWDLYKKLTSDEEE